MARPEFNFSATASPLAPLPADTTKAPALPLEDAPLPTDKQPAFPVDEVPELKTSVPLAPATPEFGLSTKITPLLVAVPSPDKKPIIPPVSRVLRPESAHTRFPCPLVPLPTLMLSLPLRPPLLDPLATAKLPEFPERADPLLNTRRPLTPDVPLF